MNILTLSTYPVEHPRHGGQHRLLNIARALRVAKHTVTSAGLLGAPHYPPSPGFLPYPPPEELNRFIPNPLLMDDWAQGQLMARDDRYFRALCAEIPEHVDAIHVEQPWLFAFARRYVSEVAVGPVLLIYGSANVEHELKRRIVTGYLGDRHAQECANIVLECETQALQHADLVCAVSDEDATWMRRHTDADVVLAANGTSDHVGSIQAVQKANVCTGHHQFALYSASAHPPNVTGFFDMFGRGVGCFAPDQRLVIAGSAGPAIQGNERFGRTPGLARHFLAPGEVSNECLAGLIATAHVNVLPITQGGGTNLKTAEALWSSAHIVATPLAMRGYEQFIGAQGVAVHEDPTDFRTALREAMAEPRLTLSQEERDRRRVVLWDSTLAGFVQRVTELTH